MARISDCLIYKFNQKIFKIISVDKRETKTWYKARDIQTGEQEYIPEDYIPYSYEITECPNTSFPPPPDIKVGDYVQYNITKGGKIIGVEKGTVELLSDDEAVIIIEKEMYGVKGRVFKDIYELSLAEVNEPIKGRGKQPLFPHAPQKKGVLYPHVGR